MVLNRNQSRQALEHVISQVFGFPAPDAPLRLALERTGITTIMDLMTMDSDQIHELQYPWKDNNQNVVLIDVP